MLANYDNVILKNEEGDEFTLVDFLFTNCIDVDVWHISEEQVKQVLTLEVGQTTSLFFGAGGTSEITRIN